MKENLEQIISDAEETIELLEEITSNQTRILEKVYLALHHFKHDVIIRRNEAGEITTKWKTTFEKNYDIQFKNEKVDKWHSFRWMLNNGYNPPPLPVDETEHSFTINPEWGVKVRFVLGEWYEERNEFVIEDIVVSEEFERRREKEEFPDLPDDFLVTLWDSWNNGYKDFDTVKLRSWGDAEEQYEKGKTIILSASHTWKEKINGETVLESDYKWKRRLERISGIVEGFDIDRYFIFLQDEPLGKPHWSLDDLNRLIRFARETLPNGARIGMSFTNGSVNKRELPTGLDYYVTPNYPFKTEYAVSIGHKEVSTKQEFDEDFDTIISRLRNKVGNKNVYVIGQGFFNTGSEGDKRHERRWKKPPIEYIDWLVEACVRNDIKGIWWWVYQIKRNHYSGLNENPDLYDNILNKI